MQNHPTPMRPEPPKSPAPAGAQPEPFVWPQPIHRPRTEQPMHRPLPDRSLVGKA